MVNNVYERSFSYKMHMIQNACNLRYKDAYTSCYICHAKCKKCTKERYTYVTKEPPHTKLTNDWAKGLYTTGKRAKGAQNSQAPPKLMH
jgi:hypothetical protein